MHAIYGYPTKRTKLTLKCTKLCHVCTTDFCSQVTQHALCTTFASSWRTCITYIARYHKL